VTAQAGSAAIDARARIAAANNADLCAAVFDAHGLRWHRDRWHFRADARPPAYYPQLVTLTPDAAAESVAAIGALARDLPPPIAVKDSFATLDLGPLGFEPLFDASWIWAASAPSADLPAAWEVLRSPADLALWEAAWAGDDAPPATRIFPDAILADPRLMVLGRRGGAGFDGGCILNRSAGAIGLSNVHGAPLGAIFDASLAAAGALAPGLPVTGYEGGDALSAAIDAGCVAVGPLRVWLRTGG